MPEKIIPGKGVWHFNVHIKMNLYGPRVEMALKFAWRLNYTAQATQHNITVPFHFPLGKFVFHIQELGGPWSSPESDRQHWLQPCPTHADKQSPTHPHDRPLHAQNQGLLHPSNESALRQELEREMNRAF
jgi:hypothetical protein